jgi:NDP-sugar pyrophosphorylase family protein
MILAAGLGTRLRPLTHDRPKALVELDGRTLLAIALERLRSFGVRQVIVNVHHFAEQVIDFVAANRSFGIRIEISREEALLDTGGGLKKAAWFFLEDDADRNQPFLLHNVDVLSNIDLAGMVQFHTRRGALATLAVQNRRTARPLLFDAEGQLRGRGAGSTKPGESALAFCGIHVISPRIFSEMQQDGTEMQEDGPFSIIDAYLRLAARGETIAAWRADESYWRDLGKPENIAQAERDLKTGVYRNLA